MNCRLFFLLLISFVASSSLGQELVILHTNDTHSQLRPTLDNQGGFLRRMAAIDSIRQTNENVLLTDAGDAVQGSLFFTLFAGEAERKLMNAANYDIQILGNHEFDNGLESLANQWKEIKAAKLSSNYVFDNPTLRTIFQPSLIKDIQGKKVGFFAINLDPEGMIMERNIRGTTYLSPVEQANYQAQDLRNQGADYVVAITHIGFKEDQELAANTTGIDLIIGGHSHTLLPHGFKAPNLDGDTVLIAQAGSRGLELGQINVDLASHLATAKTIPIDSRFDNRLDSTASTILAHYEAKVDSLLNLAIGSTPVAYDKGTPQLLNLLTDFVAIEGSALASCPIDLAILNKGGIRNSLPAGTITQGQIINILPFDNKIVVMQLLGADLIANLDIMASQGGNGVSKSVTVDDNNTYLLNGRPVFPEKTYTIATIDYLAQGNDYMKPLTQGTILAQSPLTLHKALSNAILNHQLDSLLSNPDPTVRFKILN